MFRLVLNKIIIRIRRHVERISEDIKFKLILFYQRNEAHILRKKVVKNNGVKIVNRALKKLIKAYAKQRFGKKAYWPFLALYTEIRGEFIKGWIPYDYYRFVLLPRINPEAPSYLSDQKTYDFMLFGDFAIKPLFHFISGMFFSYDLSIINRQQVLSILAKHNNKIVIKEESGHGGKGVNIIHSSSFIFDMIDIRKNYIIQPYVNQYKVLNSLYPDTLNTFRVTTYLKKNGSVIVKFVTLRFGVNNSKTDNIASGGRDLYFSLDGNPSKVAYDVWLGHKIGERHINTGYLFSDIKIPAFADMLEACKQAHKKYPYLRLIGWDVCIDSSGEPKLVEWNGLNPAFWPLEARFGPLWPNDDEF